MKIPLKNLSQARPGNRNNKIGYPHGGKLNAKQVQIIRKTFKDPIVRKLFQCKDFEHAFNVHHKTLEDIANFVIHRNTL